MKLQKFWLAVVFLSASLLLLPFLIQASEMQQKEALKEFNQIEFRQREKERDFFDRWSPRLEFRNDLFASSDSSLITYTTSILWSEISNIFVEGNYAYCAFVNGLGIIDVSDSSKPILVNTVFFPGRGEGIFVQGSLAFLADGYWGLEIIEVSDPLNPVRRGHYDTPGYSWDVFVKDNYAYIADDWLGVSIIDVSNPDNPEAVWSYDTKDFPRDIFVQGDYAYVADSYGGLFVLDVSDPTNPDTLGQFTDSSFAQGLFVKDTLVYVANRWNPEGFEIFNVKNPNQPERIGNYPVWGEEVFVWDTLACVVGGWWPQLINVVNPSKPELVGVFNTSAYTFGVWVKNDLAYVTKCTDDDINWFDGQGISGLEIIDIKYMPYIYRRGSLETPWVKQVFIQDSLAYVLVNNELKICNISDPTMPEVLGSCPTSGSASKIFVEGDIACITDTAGLQVFYVKNPFMPFWVGSYPTSRPPQDIFVRDTLSYVLEFGKLRIVNVANPLEPESVGVLNLYFRQHRFASVFILDSLAYVGAGEPLLEYLYVISVSNPQSPYLISSRQLGPRYDYADLVVKDGFAYAVSSDNYFEIYAVSDPANPQFVADFYLPQSPGWMNTTRSITIKDSLAYVTCGADGLKVISIKDPYHPYLVTEYNTPGFAYDAFLKDDHIYVADKYSLMVLESHFDTTSGVKEVADEENIPVSYSLCQNYPNPFNPETNIEFIIPKYGQVKLEIFNILGQKIKTLVDEHLKAGHYVVDWDGKDDSGKEVSSGVYLYQMQTSESSQTKKMVLLR